MKISFDFNRLRVMFPHRRAAGRPGCLKLSVPPVPLFRLSGRFCPVGALPLPGRPPVSPVPLVPFRRGAPAARLPARLTRPAPPMFRTGGRCAAAVLCMLLCLLGLLGAGCALRPDLGPASPPPLLLEGPVDPAWFERLAALDEQENWAELADLAAFVLAHSELSDKERAWGLYYSGRAHLAAGNGPRALACARAAALFLPREIKPRILHGLCELSWGNSLRGRQIMQTLAAEHPDSTAVLLAMGRANEMSGHAVAALLWYERAAAKEPDNPEVITALALGRWRAGDATGALRDLEQVVGLSGADGREAAAARNDQGVIYLALGEPERAGRAFNQALELDPANIDARVNRAGLYAARGDFPSAQADLDAGLALEPGNVKLNLAQGQVYQAQSRYFEAYTAFETAYVYGRRNPHALNELAWFLATCPEPTLRNGGRAAGLAERAIILAQPPDPGAYDTLAAAYAAAGRFDEARAAQNTAVFLAGRAGLHPETLAAWRARLKLYERGESWYAR